MILTGEGGRIARTEARGGNSGQEAVGVNWTRGRAVACSDIMWLLLREIPRAPQGTICKPLVFVH